MTTTTKMGDVVSISLYNKSSINSSEKSPKKVKNNYFKLDLKIGDVLKRKQQAKQVYQETSKTGLPLVKQTYQGA